MQSVFEKKGVIREFHNEDNVIVRDHCNHDKWINGQVKSNLRTKFRLKTEVYGKDTWIKSAIRMPNKRASIHTQSYKLQKMKSLKKKRITKQVRQRAEYK